MTKPTIPESEIEQIEKLSHGLRRRRRKGEEPTRVDLVLAAIAAARGRINDKKFAELDRVGGILQHRAYLDKVLSRWKNIPRDEHALVASVLATVRVLEFKYSPAHVHLGLFQTSLCLKIGNKVTLVQDHLYDSATMDVVAAFSLRISAVKGKIGARETRFVWSKQDGFVDIVNALFAALDTPKLPVNKRLSMESKTRLLMRLIVPWQHGVATHEEAHRSFFKFAERLYLGDGDPTFGAELATHRATPFMGNLRAPGLQRRKR